MAVRCAVNIRPTKADRVTQSAALQDIVDRHTLVRVLGQGRHLLLATLHVLFGAFHTAEVLRNLRVINVQAYRFDPYNVRVIHV